MTHNEPAPSLRREATAPEDTPLKELSVHPYNLDVYGEPDGGLKESLARFGLQHPLILDDQRRILSGARRWKAATLLGWTRVPTVRFHGSAGAETKKFILIANAYRAEKPDYIRKLEADAYLDLLKTGEATKDDLKKLVDGRGNVTNGYSSEAPTALAAAVAGISRMTYSRYRFVLDGGADRAVDKAARSGDIDQDRAAALKKLVAAQSERLRRGKAGAHTADRKIRSSLAEAQRQHSMSARERERDRASRAFERAMLRGTTFLTSVRDLGADVAHLGQPEAKALAATLSELGMVAAELGKRASDPPSVRSTAQVPLPPVRVPAALHERLQRLAMVRKCSMGTLLVQILEENVGLQEMASRTPPRASPLVGYDPQNGGRPDPRPSRRPPRVTRFGAPS